MRARLATRADAIAIAQIYNQGIEERIATFETALRSEEDILAWFDGAHPVVVVTSDQDDIPLGFARGSEYSSRECYRGVFEFSVYTERAARRRGVGELAMRELVSRARAAGAWKLVSRVFVENESSRGLFRSLGFREVGTYFRHGKLDGRWRDVVIIEKFLAPLGAEAALGPGPARPSPEQIAVALRSEVMEERVEAAAHALSLVETHQQVESGLIDAAADAFFMVKVHDAPARARFVDLFRACAGLSTDAARHLYAALFSRLEKRSIATDLDAFYEAAFVVKQVARTGEGTHLPELAPHVGQLVSWIERTIELPQAMRTRISPGNVSSLLLNLALAGCESDAQRAELAALAADAKTRLRVEPPAVLRSSPPPAPSVMPPPLPSSAFVSVDDDAVLIEDDVVSVVPPPPLPVRPPPLPGTPPPIDEPAPPSKKKRAKPGKPAAAKPRKPRTKR